MTQNRHRTPQEGLPPCPASPNCVSSDAADDSHRVAPLALRTGGGAFWAALREEIASRPRTRITADTGVYLHAEEKSRLFGFVDDVEFLLLESQGVAAVRSASRTGLADLGVNRRRVEKIRSALRARGVCD